MTVPELFHHEKRFVGCLAIRRVARFRPADRLPAGDGMHVLSADEVDECEQLAQRLLFTQQGRFSLGTQGLDYASLGACPALLADRRCGIHDDRKPATCGTVPLDPLFPDRLQHVVLMNRHLGAGYAGAECIAGGLREGYSVLVEGGAIVDAGYRSDMASQRDALAAEKAAWGDEVFALLARELFANEATARRVPSDGYLSLPLVPVLAVLASRSDSSRERCLRYVQAQIELIDAKVGQALQRKLEQDKPMTRELRGFKRAYQRLGDALAHPTP
jgi:hypothetical protein